MNNSKQKLKGFTLMELIIVIAIIVIMAGVLIPNISDYIRSNHVQSANSQAQQIYMAAQDYLVSEQLKGAKASDIIDSSISPMPKVCWITVTTEIGSDSANYDKYNKTTVVDSFGISSEYIQKSVTITENGTTKTVTKYPIADGIESRLEGSFKGSWVVAFYPKTFTVAYAVYNDNYGTTTECENAVKVIGTNNGAHSDTSCNDRLYMTEFGAAASRKLSQESDFAHPDSGEAKHLYTGQFPVPGPSF